MAYPLTLTVIFQAYLVDLIPKLASAQLSKMQNPSRDVENFLKYIVDEHAIGVGPKGSVLTWGHVGNSSTPEIFMKDLKEFWLDLYKFGAIMSSNAIIVMSQKEESMFMDISEIRQEGDKLKVRKIETTVPQFGRDDVGSEILPSKCETIEL